MNLRSFKICLTCIPYARMHTCVPTAFRITENLEQFQVVPPTDTFSRKSSLTEDGALPLSLPVFGAPRAWEGWLAFHGGSTWPARSLPSPLQSLKSSCRHPMAASLPHSPFPYKP